MANFTPRTLSPVGSYNPCWMTNLYGASWYDHWNTCIYGSPQQIGADVLSNCTGYAQGRSCEIWMECTGNNPTQTNSHPFDMFNMDAGEWIDYAPLYGFETGSQPKLGAILVTATHVAIVEEKVNDDLYYVSESGYDTLPPFSYSTSLYRSGGVWGSYYTGQPIVGFIYNPYVDDTPPTPPIPSGGSGILSPIYLRNRNNFNLNRRNRRLSR